MDDYMSPELRREVQGLRGEMIGGINRSAPLPERFAQLAAKESNRVTYLDTLTGRELTVGLCDAAGVRKALAAFFGEGS